MTRPLKILVLLGILTFVTGGCSSTSNIVEDESTIEAMSDTVTIKPSRSYEECIIVRPGTFLEYRFDASDFANFNIHYHTEEKVRYPVKQKGALFGEGTVDPVDHDYYTEDQEHYCMMWDNLNTEAIRVSFSCAVKEK